MTTPVFKTSNEFRKALLDGECLIGCWASLGSQATAEMLGLAGFDWILFDGEHSPNDLRSFIQQILALKGSRSAPVVRPAASDIVMVKQLLDIGFSNFLMPWIETKEQAENMVAATRYPPQGVRGVSVATRANRYGYSVDYHHKANENISVIAQIETRTAVENVEEIAAVEGIDALFIGPSDLSASYGVFGQSHHPEVEEAIGHVAAAGKRHRKSLGVLAPVEANARKYLANGFNLVSVGSDIGLFRKAADELRTRFS